MPGTTLSWTLSSRNPSRVEGVIAFALDELVELDPPLLGVWFNVHDPSVRQSDARGIRAPEGRTEVCRSLYRRLGFTARVADNSESGALHARAPCQLQQHSWPC